MRSDQFDPGYPHAYPAAIKMSQVSDQTDFIQLGQKDEDLEFFQVSYSEAEKSAWRVWPTGSRPTSLYQFCSISLHLDQDLTVIERTSWSGFEWLA